MLAAFDLPQIGRSPARFDFAKLESLYGYYLRHTDDAALLAELDRVLPRIAAGPELAAKLTADTPEKLLAPLRGLEKRPNNFGRLAARTRFSVAGHPLPIAG